ncbi:MAG: hypothetical protein WAN36_16240 [Calditrichia bacterium]
MFEKVDTYGYFCSVKNLYKRTDVFRCVHEAHRNFKSSLSVNHILKEKDCYPYGCFYFRWHCKLLSKQSRCHRGFSHVGRKCTGCKHFYEDKIHNYPELQISEAKYREFLDELSDFEEWLEENLEREHEIAGRVAGIKPLFRKKVYPKTSYYSFQGYLLIFREVFIGRIHFEDEAYLRVSRRSYQNLRVGTGSELEFSALLKMDRGRILLERMRRVDVVEKGSPPDWNDQKVLVARETATEFPEQPENCVRCAYGALVDVDYQRDHRAHSKRSLLCLKGMQDYQDCYIGAGYCGLDNEADESCRA